jgi:Fe-S cluster assembly iron-binding protein IscA
MLSVTSSAKEKLKDDLHEAREDEMSLVRIAHSSQDPQKLGFTLDLEKEGDHVITDDEGEKLLLIGEDIGPTLTGLVLDYGDTEEGLRFTITQS